MEDTNELETIKAQAEEYLAGWKRAQADYANLKKDTDRDRQEFVKFANENLLSDFLPAIDQYDVALAHTPDISGFPEDEQKKLKNWIIGLHAVKALWENAFQTIGLERVTTVGAFDPQIHEAVGHEASETIPKGDIIKAMQDGWKLNGKLLRPARVIISE